MTALELCLDALVTLELVPKKKEATPRERKEAKTLNFSTVVQFLSARRESLRLVSDPHLAYITTILEALLLDRLPTLSLRIYIDTPLPCLSVDQRPRKKGRLSNERPVWAEHCR